MTLHFGCKFNDAPPDNTSLTAGTMSAECDIDTDKINRFFEENVESDLQCLEAKLTLYAQVDQREDIDYIDEKELGSFLSAFMTSEIDLEHGVTTLFEANHHIFNEPRGKIGVENIPNLFNFLRSMNRSILPIYSAFKLIDIEDPIIESEFFSNQSELMANIEHLATEVLNTINAHSANRPDLEIDEIFELGRTEKNAKSMDDISSLRFLKVLLLGGNEDILTFAEVKTFLGKLPTLAKLSYDIFVGFKVNFGQDDAYMEMLIENIETLKAMFFHEEGNNEKYFHYEEIIKASTRYSDLLLDLEPFSDSVREVKHSQIIGPGVYGDYFSYNNIIKVIGYAEDILERLHYFQKMWLLNEDTLLSPNPIEDNLSEVSTHETFLNKEFSRLVKTYKFYRGDEPVPYYSYSNKRNFKGLGEIVVYEYALKLFFKAYSQLEREDRITEEEFLGVVLAYDDFVTEMKLWKNPVSGMAKTNYLMMDYFRYNANANGYIDLKEAIEYVTMQLSSYKIADQVYDTLESDCLNESGCYLGGDLNGVPTMYFYNNFFRIFNEFRGQFPKLYKYYLTLDEDGSFDYVRNLSKFARQCPYDYEDGENEITISKRDVILVTGGLISLEETFLALDHDQDDVLSFEELELASDHFKEAIMEFGGLSPATAFLARTVFFYLILKQKVPTPIQAIGYHIEFNLFVNKKKIAADRGAIASILVNFSDPPEVPDQDCRVEKPVPR
jgi:hypothetical protein